MFPRLNKVIYYLFLHDETECATGIKVVEKSEIASRKNYLSSSDRRNTVSRILPHLLA